MTAPVKIRIGAVTFIELLIVIIIIGVLAGLAAPLLRNSLDNLTLDNFAGDLYYLSRYLQASAINAGKIYALNIDKDTPALRALYLEENEFRGIPGRLGRNFIAPKGIAIACEPAGKSKVYFYPDGRVDRVTLAFKNQHGKNLFLIIKGASGEIKIQ